MPIPLLVGPGRALLGVPGGQTAFTPLALPNLVGWWRADSGVYQDAARTTPATADGDPVGGWADQSGAGNHLGQATGSKRPTLQLAEVGGHNAVKGDGADDLLTVPAIAPQTVGLAWQNTSAVPGGAFWMLVSLAGLEIALVGDAAYRDVSFIYGGNGTSSGFDAAAALTSAAPHALTVTYLGGGVSTPPNYRATLDGVAQTVVASAAFASGSTSTLLSRSGGFPAAVKLVEVVACTDPLNTSDEARLATYLLSGVS